MAKTKNAITRVPLPSGGEFVAWWPVAATRGDLAVAGAWMDALLAVWEKDADQRAQQANAGEIEYRSWLTPNVAIKPRRQASA